MLQTACMVMEAFADVSKDKVVYDIVGHSGESDSISFVEGESPPANANERFKVLQEMHAHSQFCMSGDHTLEATQKAIGRLGERDDADERYVVVLSDANLDRCVSPFACPFCVSILFRFVFGLSLFRRWIFGWGRGAGGRECACHLVAD
jgi:hypothetical protein